MKSFIIGMPFFPLLLFNDNCIACNDMCVPHAFAVCVCASVNKTNAMQYAPRRTQLIHRVSSLKFELALCS